MTSTWKKLPPVETQGPACLCCGTPTAHFPPDSVIAVGFGAARVTRDGVSVYEEQATSDGADCWTGADAERAAAADPDHDWRIYKIAPLYEAEYQRHAPGEWVLVSRGMGFA